MGPEYLKFSTESLAQLEPPTVLMEDTINFVRELQYTPEQRKKDLLDEYSMRVVSEPGSIRPILHNLSMVSIAEPSLNPEGAQKAFLSNTEQLLARNFNIESWSPDKIAKLINAGISGSDIHGTDIEKVEAALFNSPTTINEAIDLFYSAAWAMVVTPRHDIRSELFSILTLRKDWFDPSSSSAQHFMSGLYAPDDIHLAKYHAILTALDYIAVFTDQPTNNILRFAGILANLSGDARRRWETILEEQKSRLGSKFESLRKAYEKFGFFAQTPDEVSSDVTQGRAEYELSHVISQWPNYIIRNPNEPLRRAVLERFGDQVFRAKWENRQIALKNEGYEFLTEHPVQLASNLSLSIMARRIQSNEQREWLVTEVTQTLISGQPDNPRRRLFVPLQRAIAEARLSFGLSQYFDREKNIVFAIYRSHSEEELGRLASALEYHRLPISTELFEDITKKISAIRRTLHILYTRRVGTRGYKVVIADPYLRNRGYQSITFRQNKENNNITVDLALEGQIYNFALDNDYRIQPSSDVKKFASLQDQVWLELLTLSNLKKVMCTEEDKIEEELYKKPEQKKTLKRQRYYKVATMKHMKQPLKDRDGNIRVDEEGRSRFPHYTTEADELFKKSNMPDNDLERHFGLALVNQERAKEGRGGTPETGWWTYVRPSIKEDDQEYDPIRIAFNYIGDIYDVVPKEIMTEAETRRLDEELFGTE